MKRRIVSLILAAALCLTLPGCGSGSVQQKNVQEQYEISRASYPEQVNRPNYDDYTDDKSYLHDWDLWQNDRNAHRERAVGTDIIAEFLTASAPEFITGTQGNEVYSPINVYMALAMLAELTDGNSRDQILSLLGSESIDDLRAQAEKIWDTAYRDDGAVSSILASSLWLHEEVDFVQETMDSLAQNYYASSYRGTMGSDGLNRALQGWLNEQTGGLLEEQAFRQELTADTILALAGTIYFRAGWSDKFNADRTEEGEFIILSPDGGTYPCEYMRSFINDNHYWGENFTAVSKRLENDGRMWLIKPDSDTFVGQLLDDPTTMDFLLSNGDWENRKEMMIDLSVPKFDVSGSIDLKSGMQRLGITDVFDSEVSDFTPMTTQTEGIYLSRADHAARVKIDEEGVEAAAYTVMSSPAEGRPPMEEIEFILDRPFLFAITTESGLPLFLGVVQKPF